MTTDLTTPAVPDEDDLRDLRALACSMFDNLACEALNVQQTAVPFDRSLWTTLSEAGLTLLTAPVSAGGSGAGIAEAAVVLSAAAEYAAPLPIAENDLLAAWLLDVARLDVPTGPLTSGLCELSTSPGNAGQVHVVGTLERVPWARNCEVAVVLGSTESGAVVLVLPLDRCTIVEGHNLAHEPRDAVHFDLELPQETVVPVGDDLAHEWLLRGALARSAQTCGAMETALAMTIDHATQRTQFGRPLGRFQAVQHLVTDAAGEVSAARAACEVAIRTAVRDGIASPSGELAVAIAKSQASRAAEVVSRGAHQVHGAIGFTLDHKLRHFTLRMLAWRDEFDSAQDWERRVGDIALTAGEDLWSLVSSGRPDPAQ
jgi:acyl-CoA dehydrogenase